MSDSAVRLQQAADEQISQLIDLLSTRDQSVLKLQCPGREKLGDGTVAASAMHTTDNYHRIADFLNANDHRPRAPREAKRSHRLPRVARARRHAAGHSSGSHPHSLSYFAPDIDLRRLLERLSTARESLRPLADLSNEQLGTIPPAGEMKFCDGQRTLQQTLASLLNHQRAINSTHSHASCSKARGTSAPKLARLWRGPGPETRERAATADAPLSQPTAVTSHGSGLTTPARTRKQVPAGP